MNQLNKNIKKRRKGQLAITLDRSVKEPVKVRKPREQRQIKPNRVHPIFEPILEQFNGGKRYDN